MDARRAQCGFWLQSGGLRGPSWDHRQGLKPVEASGKERGARVYGGPGGSSPSGPPEVSWQTLVFKELSHTFQTLSCLVLRDPRG